jgi:hypothetical protein
MLDHKSRAWFTARIHGPQASTFCRKGSEHPSAKLFPIERAGRQFAMYDPKAEKFTLIDTCFSTHHLQLDAKNRMWASSGVGGNGNGDVVGWIDVDKFDKTGDEQASQGWTPIVIDTNGNGKRDEGYVDHNAPVDPTKDKRIQAGFYGIAPSPADGTIWGSVLGFPGMIVRLDPGDDPNHALSEIYEVPAPGYSPRGLDIDTQGVVWVPLASGHMGSFDRRKCKGPLNGPTATGKHCPEGWTLYRLPGPQFEGVSAPETAARRPATTPSWTSTTCSGSARTCRWRPATTRIRSTPWSMGSSSSCGCRIPWDFSPRVSTAASTIPMRAGKAGRSGRPMATGHRSISRAARAPSPRWSNSSSGPIRSRADARLEGGT